MKHITFNEVISKRRTIRDFRNEPIQPGIIRHAIDNAFKAPSYNHMREWDFIIVENLETKLKLIESENLDKNINLEELAELFKDEEPVKKEMYVDAIPKQKKMIIEAPMVVIVVYKPKTKIEDVTRVYDLNCLASAWACIENFLLSLTEYNVFGVTYIPQHTETIKQRIGIPNPLEIAAIIPIGYKADTAKTLVQKEINIAERIHFEKW